MHGRGYQSGGVSFGPPVTPPIIKQLLIANVAVFVAQHLLSYDFTRLFSIVPRQFWEQGYLWQPFTYMWLHSPQSLWHVGFNMLALWMFGSPLALVWGERRFLRFYLITGVGAGLLIVTWPALLVLFGWSPSSYIYPTLGASGAVYGVLLGYSLTWPDRTIMLLFPPIPIKAIYFIPFILGLSILMGPQNVSHVGHIGGVAVAWVLLRRQGGVSLLPSLASVRYRLRRWRMRRQLRAVRDEESEWRRRRDDGPRIH
ncbi:MAG: rhomboid family intramembrane serine protease [Myxococcota bacterium]